MPLTMAVIDGMVGVVVHDAQIQLGGGTGCAAPVVVGGRLRGSGAVRGRRGGHAPRAIASTTAATTNLVKRLIF